MEFYHKPILLENEFFFRNPTQNSNGPQAKPITKDDFHFMHLTNRGIKIRKNPNKQRINFWQNFFINNNYPVKKITYCPRAAEADATV